MPKTVKKIVLVAAAFIVVVFAVFLFNQTTQIVQSARAVNVVFGDVRLRQLHQFRNLDFLRQLRV